MRKIIKQNKAVSEVLGTILLLVISVTVFSAVYASFFSTDLGPDVPSVSLIGVIEDNNLKILHQGGEDLNLNTRVIMRPNQDSDDSEKVEVDDYLDIYSKEDGRWNIGESFVYDLSTLTNFQEFNPLEVLVIDQASNSVIMRGTIKEAAISDLGISIDIIENDPINVDSDIVIEFNLENYGPSATDDVSVEIVLPEMLVFDFVEPSSDGSYNPESGLWDIGYIDSGSSAKLALNLKVKGPNTIDTQLAFILDGSDFINATEWTNILNGIADAIENDIPHNGHVELTVVQYGGNADSTYHLADTIIDQAEITSENYMNVANTIKIVPKSGGRAAMACGIRQTTEELISSDLYSHANSRTIITIVTGGPPNHVCLHPTIPTLTSVKKINGMLSAQLQRNHMIQQLFMQYGLDEIDCIVYADEYTTTDSYLTAFVPWLKSKIVYPGPMTTHSLASNSNRPGWVEEVTPADDFSVTLQNYLAKIFKSGTVTATIVSSAYEDPDLTNNAAEIVISPIS